jgi:biotin synthase
VSLKEELIMLSVGSSTQLVSIDRGTWTTADARAIYELPFNDLLFRAQSVHRSNFNPNQLQFSKLLSIKTGGSPKIAATAVSPRGHRPVLTHQG